MSEQHPPVAGGEQASGAPTDEAARRAPGQPQDAVLKDGGSSSLADGEWHRMHPLTPLMRGGLVLLIVVGIVFANLRDQLVALVLDFFIGGRGDVDAFTGDDPVGWILENQLVGWAALATLGVFAILFLLFWLVWRFQDFRISDDYVESRKGILFRSSRRAPLDRVQGVNLTRPFPARLFGMAKLEVVGAGADANVPLEYLATKRAESVRVDILNLAAGARRSREVSRAERHGHNVVDTVSQGVRGIISGVDRDDVPPELLLKIPAGRLVGSVLVVAVIPIVLLVAFVAVGLSILLPIVLEGAGNEGLIATVGVLIAALLPLIIVMIAVTWGQIAKYLRFSIAPTPDGVRTTYGLLSTTTETMPPGRVFAIEVVQPLLWRPFGWWFIRINRMSGKSESAEASSRQQQAYVLPVGKQPDVDRVLGMFMPYIPLADQSLLWDDGMRGPRENDPFHTMPKRARWRRPFSGKRHGYLLTAYALLLRRGNLPRKLAIFPLARIQGISIAQGPIDRAQGVAWGQAHSIRGQVTGVIVGLERDDAVELLNGTSAGIVAAARADHSHRLAQQLQ